MRVMFIHQNFPGQFRYLSAALAARGHEVRALAITPRYNPPGVKIHSYQPGEQHGRCAHPWTQDFDTKTIRAHACARKMVELDTAGFVPDVVVGHPGWGETWMVKDVWPAARLLAFQEFFYGADLNFDPEFPEHAQDSRFRIRIKNAGLLPGLDSMDWGMSPTEWQRRQFPADYRRRISVVFDGVDTRNVCPERVPRLTWEGQPRPKPTLPRSITRLAS